MVEKQPPGNSVTGSLPALIKSVFAWPGAGAGPHAQQAVFAMQKDVQFRRQVVGHPGASLCPG